MIKPPAFAKGNKIGLVVSARKSTPEELILKIDSDLFAVEHPRLIFID